ncbi:MAG: hypothetical protein ACQESF_03420 [Nanobdellota archaeon]
MVYNARKVIKFYSLLCKHENKRLYQLVNSSTNDIISQMEESVDFKGGRITLYNDIKEKIFSIEKKLSKLGQNNNTTRVKNLKKDLHRLRGKLKTISSKGP